MPSLVSMKRWLGRLIRIGVLVAAGWLAFHYAKSRPRCVITCKTHAIHFSDDGNTLITGYTGMYLGPIYQMGKGTPPLEVWDTRSGKVVRTLLADLEAFEHFVKSPQAGRVAVRLGHKIRVADWRTGDEWDIDVGPGVVESMEFSPRGDLLSVWTDDPGTAHALIDVERRAVLDRFPGKLDGYGFSADGARWYYVSDGRLHAWNIPEKRVDGTLAVALRLRSHNDWALVAYVSPVDLSVVICDGRAMTETTRLKPAWRALPKFDDPRSAGLAFSPSGRFVATHIAAHSDLAAPLELWDISDERRIAVLPEFQKGRAWFVDDDTLLFFDYTQPPPLARFAWMVQIVCIDAADGTVRWKRQGFDSRFFSLDGTTALCASPEATWDFIDLATGQTRHSLPQPFVNDASMVAFNKEAHVLCNMGRRHGVEMPISWREWLYRWIDTESGGVQVIDARRQRVVADLHCSVNAGGVVSGDGKTVCVYDFSFGSTFGTIGPFPPESHTFRFYDLHSNQPWLWAIGAPAGIMILWLLWRTWRGRRSNATTPAATVGPGSSRRE